MVAERMQESVSRMDGKAHFMGVVRSENDLHDRLCAVVHAFNVHVKTQRLHPVDLLDFALSGPGAVVGF
jgi:hypothetical protein